MQTIVTMTNTRIPYARNLLGGHVLMCVTKRPNAFDTDEDTDIDIDGGIFRGMVVFFYKAHE